MKLRSYQQEAIDSVFDYFREKGPTTDPANPLVAMPTGTGKSVVIGGLVQQAFDAYAGQRWMMMTHVKELIKQNASKLEELWPLAPMGIYSAGLNQKDTALPIIFGGVKSVANNLDAFGRRDVILVDEAHLVSPKATTTYQTVFKHFRKINPYLKIVGFTATGYRMGQGDLTEGGLFTDTCFDITGVDSFNRLIAEGYLAPLISFQRDIGVDLSDVAVSSSTGDYQEGDLQRAFDLDAITERGLRLCCEYAADRRCWLIFASGVKHAESIASMLSRFGISAAAIHSKLEKGERDARIEAYKKGQIRCLVGNNILTTGFDHPPIDFIAMFRATLSPGLWVQMLGRGTRPYDYRLTSDPLLARYFQFTKQNCLVFDFGGNGRRLGPINDPRIPKRKGKGPPGPPPIKECEYCGCDNHISARFCVNCKQEFTFEVKIVEEAAQTNVMANDTPVVETLNVHRVFYMPYKTRSKGEIVLKASYHCEGLKQFDEFVWLEGKQKELRGKKARDWWRQRHHTEPPETVDEALKFISELRPPSRIRVWVNKQYPEILGAEFSNGTDTHSPLEGLRAFA